MKERQALKNEEQRKISELDISNDRFNDMKNIFAEKRKNYIDNQALDRIKRSEQIAQVNQETQRKIDESKTKFLDTFSQVKGKDGYDILQKEVQKKQFKKEEEEFQQLHVDFIN
jgi:uncharacterized secreted protein with C-terminal beta-propeller domain